MSDKKDLDDVPGMEGYIELNGMALHTLDPGEIDVTVSMSQHLIDLNYSSNTHYCAVNSDRRSRAEVLPNSLAFYPKGTSLSLATTNNMRGFLLEVNDHLMTEWCEKSELDQNRLQEYYDYKEDPVSSRLGRILIDHMTSRNGAVQSFSDKLTLEALSLGIGARLVARMETGGGNVQERVEIWRDRHDSKNITRAMDYAEANLHDPGLTVSEMAAAACLSPCHFSTVFKTQANETPYNYILRRRAERARTLLENTRLPLAEIALDVGFSSQAHMSTMLKRRFGATPRQLRNA